MPSSKDTKIVNKYDISKVNRNERSPFNNVASEHSESNTVSYHYKHLNSTEDPEEVECSDSSLRFNPSVKTAENRMSASSASVEEKYIMLEMQRKLEMIESKLNYFMDESKYDQEYDRTSFPILDHNESKFLEHARKQLNMPSELSSKPKTSITRSSVQESETSSQHGGMVSTNSKASNNAKNRITKNKPICIPFKKTKANPFLSKK